MSGGSTFTHLCPQYGETIPAGRDVAFVLNFFMGRWFLLSNDYARSVTFCPWCGKKLENPEVHRGG